MKSAALSDIVKFLNAHLNVAAIADSSANGLQVEGPGKVKKIAFMVDASLDGAKKAQTAGAQMIVVHHGLIWGGGIKTVSGALGRMIAYLIKNNIALYAAHLPLDLHTGCGNNIGLARLLKLKNIKAFAHYNGQNIGFYGRLPKAQSVKELARVLENGLKTKTMILPFGPKSIKTVGVVSGAAADCMAEAVQLGLDLFITGEPRQSAYHQAQENGINIIFAGHYATETLGVKALMPILQRRFGVQTAFIDLPTGI